VALPVILLLSPVLVPHMGMQNRRWSRNTLARAGLFVAVSTIALTASFLGVVGLLTGRVSGLTNRLPFYVLAMAVAFVGSIVVLEEEYRRASQILQLSVIVTVVTFVLVTLGGEGVSYLVQNREEVVTSQLIFYILAAGLIGTGFCYWALQHWSELARDGTELGS
jgi:nitrate/nitrite transporter NarK